MSEDIVKRLEQIETDIEYSDVAHVCGKAADEIKRLRAVLAKIRRDYSSAFMPEDAARIDAALNKGGEGE